MGRITSFRSVDERYPVLRFVASVCAFIGVVLMILGVLLLVVGLLPAIRSVPVMAGGFGILAIVVWSFSLFMAGVQLLALGSCYRLAIHIEENTRAAAQALEGMRREAEPRVILNPPPLFPS